jgi:nitrate reductase delta subunit
VLLQYPEYQVSRVVPQLHEAAAGMSADEQRGFESFLQWFAETPLLAMQSHYVELFDRKRRACLYMSYYLNGDTRRRGMALVEFKDLYRAGGWEASEDELPDFLPTLLQFCAVADVDAGETVLASHRSGLVVLDTALCDAHSPYRHLSAVLLSLVPAGHEAEEQAQALIAAGPPTELVGLEPFSAAETIGVGAR